MKAVTRGPAGPEAELRREHVLELEGEQVLVPPGDEVHRVAHAPQEVERRGRARRRRARPAPRWATSSRKLRTLKRTFAIQSAVCRSRRPPSPVLQLRLQQVDAVAQLGVPLLALLQLLAEERLLVRHPHLVDDAGLELVVRRPVAAEVAGVEQRRLHLQVARRQAACTRARCASRRPPGARRRTAPG